jgi:hypothetical protein
MWLQPSAALRWVEIQRGGTVMDELSAEGTSEVSRSPSRPTKRQREAAKAAAASNGNGAADARATAAAAAEAQAAAEAEAESAARGTATTDLGTSAAGSTASSTTDLRAWARETLANASTIGAGAATAIEATPAAGGSDVDVEPDEPAGVPEAAAPSDDDEDGEHLEVRRSAVARIRTDEVIVDQGAIGAAQAKRVSIERGALGAAMAYNVEVSRSYARSILARHVQLDRAAARVIIAADVRADQSAAMFLIARKVDGNVRVLLDWRGALAFGAVAGLVFAMLSRARSIRGLRSGKR